MASWRKFFPDYEIKEWNESNFDVNEIPYTQEAYKAGKYAFVSDYARFKILYEYGGVYFDTDVEVIKSFDDILERGTFMGLETIVNDSGLVAPGLGMGAVPGHGIFREIMANYAGRHFINADGSFNQTTVGTYTTAVLNGKGLKAVDEIQQVSGVTVYPVEYFNPMDNNTGRLKITPNTRSIHRYDKTWLDVSPWRIWLSRMAHRYLGFGVSGVIGKLFHIHKPC